MNTATALLSLAVAGGLVWMVMWIIDIGMLHDVPHHTRQRWLTYRRRWAAGDLFLGPYVVGTMIQETAR